MTVSFNNKSNYAEQSFSIIDVVIASFRCLGRKVQVPPHGLGWFGVMPFQTNFIF